MAREGIHQAGVLSFGPYVSLPKGKYSITFFYESTSEQSWDVVGNAGGKSERLSSGILPYLGPGEVSFSTPLEVGQINYSYEFRTLFNGRGQVKINRIELQANSSP
jgi:hypothetical protein